MKKYGQSNRLIYRYTIGASIDGKIMAVFKLTTRNGLAVVISIVGRCLFTK